MKAYVALYAVIKNIQETNSKLHVWVLAKTIMNISLAYMSNKHFFTDTGALKISIIIIT